MSATKGRIYKLKNHCYIVNHLATLELQENAHPDYILYALHKYSPVKLINDSAYPSISQSVIEKYSIPLPPLKDQVRIASLLSRIEELVAKRKESIRLLDEFVKSTFLEMFGDPVRNEKGWERYPIERFVTTIKTESPSKYPEKSFEYIDIAAINNKTKIIEEVKIIIGKDAPSRARQLVQSNDILVSTVRPNPKTSVKRKNRIILL